MVSTPECTPGELGQVMDRYAAMVYRLAYAQLRRAADAEDISQEVFLRYYQKRPEFTSEEHRKAWLLKVTLNRVRSYSASAWRRRTVPLEEAAEMTQPEERELSEALDQLSAKDRSLIHLYYYEDLTAREIGTLLGRKESTVRTQLTRARERLGKILKGEAYEGSLPESI